MLSDHFRDELVDSFVELMKRPEIDDDVLWDVALVCADKLQISLSEFCNIAYERYTKNLARKLGDAEGSGQGMQDSSCCLLQGHHIGDWHSD